LRRGDDGWRVCGHWLEFRLGELTELWRELDPRLQALFDSHAASSLDKQLVLREQIAERAADWQFDLDEGCLSFGVDIRWRTQVLGTTSDHATTWDWAWADGLWPIPPAQLKAARALRDYGQKHGFDEFTRPQVQLGAWDSFQISVVAAGLCQAQAHFRAPYAGGTLHLLVLDPAFPQPEREPLARIMEVFPQAIRTYTIADERRALLALARYHRVAANIVGGDVHIGPAEQPTLLATFDDEGRFAQFRELSTVESQKT
jgi:hypothetical protein